MPSHPSAITRRGFLKPLTAGSLAAFFAACGRRSADVFDKASITTAEVMVIGAGIAGLAAARALADAGISVIVLEARKRIGGRIWSASFGDSIIELGASWIHGVRGNPVTRLAQEAGLRPLPTDYDDLWLYDQRGRVVPDRKVEDSYREFVRVMDGIRAYRRQREQERRPDISLARALDLTVKSPAEAFHPSPGLAYWLRWEVEQDYGADLADLSLYRYDREKAFSGPDAILPEGYSRIPDYLARGLDIRTGRPVSQVQYDASGVEVIARDESYRATRALITLPLGVLKRGSVRFVPALPPEKLRAIRRLGMGLLNKTYLRFPRIFWPESREFLGRLSKGAGYWSSWMNMAAYTGVPILLGFHAGEQARRIEAMAGDAVVDSAMKALRATFGAPIPDPEAAFVTHCSQDSYAQGAYSYPAVGATSAHYDTLAAPVQDRLFFAGEATDANYPATVHGAYLSGLREARRIQASFEK